MATVEDCPHRKDIHTVRTRDGRDEERCICALLEQALTHRHIVDRAICERCTARSVPHDKGNAVVQGVATDIANAYFIGESHIETIERKGAIDYLIRERAATRADIQDLLLAAASKGTISEGEIGELDDYATGQIGVAAQG